MRRATLVERALHERLPDDRSAVTTPTTPTGPRRPSRARTVDESAASRPIRPSARQARAPRAAAADRHGPARIIALCNQKGGVGKTTSTINLGAALAEFGRRVLLVDFDPQGALSVGLGVQPHQLDRTIYNLLMERGVTHRRRRCSRPASPGWTCCRATSTCPPPRCSWSTRWPASRPSPGSLAPVLADYDFVLIDCQPSLGLLTVNALTAAARRDHPAGVRVLRLRGVALLIDTIDKVQRPAQPATCSSTASWPRCTTAAPCTAARSSAGSSRPSATTVFDTVISRTVRFPETTVAGEPITTWAPNSPGADGLPHLGPRGHRPLTSRMSAP